MTHNKKVEEMERRQLEEEKSDIVLQDEMLRLIMKYSGTKEKETTRS